MNSQLFHLIRLFIVKLNIQNLSFFSVSSWFICGRSFFHLTSGMAIYILEHAGYLAEFIHNLLPMESF